LKPQVSRLPARLPTPQPAAAYPAKAQMLQIVVQRITCTSLPAAAPTSRTEIPPLAPCIVKVLYAPRHICIRLSGELDHHSAKGLLRRLDQEIEKALPTQLTLDLSGVTFMDSSGIALLIRARQRMQELGGTADVCGAAAQARRVLDAAGLQRYLTIR